MTGKNVGLAYFYLVSAASLLLIVVGIFKVVNVAVNLSAYDQYPLRYSQPSCEVAPDRYKSSYPMDANGKQSSPSAEELEAKKNDCLKQESLERKEHKIDDIKDAITFPLIGLFLFFIHFPKARELSKID